MATVSKRSWTTNHGEKRSAWVVSYYDHQGQQHRLQFKTKREADDERVRVDGELAGGTHVADRDSVTVLVAAQAFLADFEALVTAGKRERSTLHGYRQHVGLHLAPFAIAGTKLARLTGPLCLDYARDLETSRSPAMARRYLSTLRTILDFAVGHGWCASNPAKGVQIRAATREAFDDEDAPAALPPKEDIRRLFKAADKRDDRGKAGRRTIPLPPETAKALKRWILAAPVGDLDLVFPTGVGTVESYANIYNRFWVPLMAEAGLALAGEADKATQRPAFALHALRHVACSLWIEQGGNVKQVQAWAGHASVQFTLDRYGHLWDDGDAGASVGRLAESTISKDQ